MLKLDDNFKKHAGYALVIGSFFLIVTMALHPAGGSFEHLLKITKVIVIAHTIAILSVPIILFGFLGLHKSFDQAQSLSIFAFLIMALGNIAVLNAAALNGWVLPMFINSYKDATPDVIEAIRPILKYNSTLNHAFDYIFIGATCIAILLWSIAILRIKTFPVWLAYFGILLNVGFLMGLVLDFNFVNLYGFRVFIFSLVGWIVAAGVLMIKSKNGIA